MQCYLLTDIYRKDERNIKLSTYPNCKYDLHCEFLKIRGSLGKYIIYILLLTVSRVYYQTLPST